jgi:outer membrane protein assembly factor BamB
MPLSIHDDPLPQPDVTKATNAPRADPELAGSTGETVTLPPRAADAEAITLAPTSDSGGVERVAVPGYEILDVLGRGGMGVVYKAKHLGLNRIVALKMILAGGHADAHDLLRFRSEAEAVARLQHPNIVQIFDVGETQGCPYFSLEFVPGGSLDKRLAGVPQMPDDAALLLETIARAIRYAHEQGVVHRDLKPANVLLAEDGTPKITDFGLAKKLDESGLTASGAVMGTPSYMAPEQASGRTHEIGPAADVYALGAILYEMLTGRPPFRGTTAYDTVLQVLSEEPAPPRLLQSKVPRDLETICLKCLRKEPGQRYASAAELADDARRYLNGEPIKARRPGPVERGVRWLRKQRRSAVLATVAALSSLLLVVIGLLVWQWYRESGTGRVLLTTDVPTAVTAELLDDQGEVVQRLTLPMAEPATFPAGSHYLRLSAPGGVTEKVQLLVEGGKRHEFPLTLGDRHRGIGITPPQGFDLVTPVPGPRVDARPTLIWASRNHLDIQAIRADSESPRWVYRSPGLGPAPFGVGAVVPPVPCATGDRLLLITTFAASGNKWVEGIDAATGKRAWSFACPNERNSGESTPTPAEVVSVGGQSLVLCQSGTRLLQRDAATGKPSGPDLPLGNAPAPPHAAALDGGRAAVWALRNDAGAGPVLTSFALPSGEKLWERSWEYVEPVKYNLEEITNTDTARPDGPLVAALAKDGPPSVVVTALRRAGSETWAAVECLDGSNGEVRWSHPMTKRRGKLSLKYARLIDGPDLDGDGWREVFVAALYDGELYVDAVSGKDGRSLWWRRYPLPEGSQRFSPLLYTGLPRWWCPGPDGWPQLVVPICVQPGNTFPAPPPEARLYVLAGGDGTLTRLVNQAGEPHVADLDGDGLPELNWSHAGKWQMMAGSPPEVWRRLPPRENGGIGSSSIKGRWEPGADLDGDGVPDLVNAGAGVAAAISGRDGRALWPSLPELQGSEMISPAAGQGDFDGDGRPDALLVFGGSYSSALRGDPFLRGLSGKTGKLLWESADLHMNNHSGYAFRADSLRTHDLDGDGRSEVIVISNWSENSYSSLFVLSGKDGTTSWQRPLRDATNGSFQFDIVSDSGRAGRANVLLSSASSDGTLRMWALNGATGTSLWEQRTPGQSLKICERADQDGHALIAVLKTSEEEFQISLLDAADGSERGRWQAARVAEPAGTAPWLRFLPPVAAKGVRGVATLLIPTGANNGHVVVIDADGKTLSRFTVQYDLPPKSDAKTPPRILALDVAGDGNEALVFLGQGKVNVMRADGTSAWSVNRPLLDEPRALLGVQPGRNDRPAVVWVRSGGTVYGLDGPTGRPIWRCDGPGEPETFLAPERGAEPPRVLFRLGDETLVCLLALPTDDAGHYGSSLGRSRADAPIPDDPRLKRYLPWRRVMPIYADDEPLEAHHLQYWADRVVRTGLLPGYLAALAVSFGLAYWWVPVWLARLAWRRSFLLAPLPLAWLGSAIWFLPQIPFFPSSNSEGRLAAMVLFPMLGVAGLPLLTMLAIAWSWLRQRRWRRVAILLGSVMMLTIAAIAVGLALDADSAAPWEHYAWLDALLLPLMWLYVLGILVLVGRFFWWLFGPRKKRKPVPTLAADVP